MNEVAAYTAGILDGEGWLGIKREKHAHRDYFYPIIVVGSTDHRLVEWLQDHWSGRLAQQAKGTQLGDEVCLTWTVTGRNLVAMLHKVAPYLTIKAPKAKLLLYLLSRIRPTGSAGMGAQEHNLRRLCYDWCRVRR